MAYEPHFEKRREILAYFEERPSFAGVPDQLQRFWERPGHDSAVSLLKAYFELHRQGDIESLRQVTAAFADKRITKAIVDSLLADDDALQRVARTSYPHPIGFDKLVLFHHRPEGRESQGFKLRLHIYWRSPQDVGHELVHLHRFEMASAPITGELSNDLLRVISFDRDDGDGDENKNKEGRDVASMVVHASDPAAAERRPAYAYTGYQRDRDGTLHKRYMGRVVLERIGRETFLTGDTYSQILEHAHYVETNAETGHANGDFCSTIYIHGPGLADEQGRTLPVLFEEARLPDDDTLIEPIPCMEPEHLRASLERYAELLDESISFYDWLYDPRYGRDLSVGMLAGYLLSEHLQTADTLSLWQHRYPECKQVLEDCARKLRRLLRDPDAELRELSEDDRTTRYYKMLLRKARREPEGVEAWLEAVGDLKKELWRYFGALIGDYARNPDLRTLKPIWEKNFRQIYGELEGRNLDGGAHYGHVGAMLEAAFAAGDIHMKYFRRGLRGVAKDGGGGPVSRADVEAQEEIRRILARHFPSHAFVGEEGRQPTTEPTTDGPATDGARRFLVDPLDGTSNFLHGHKDFAVSIACQVFEAGAWQTTDGVVALPAHHEVFWAERGKGAFLIDDRDNESRLRVRRDEDHDGFAGKAIFVSMGGLGPDALGRFLARLAEDRVRLRANGSVAVMTAQVSGCGAHATLATAADYDVAAGRLIAREAGAVASERRFERTIESSDGPRRHTFKAFLVARSPELLAGLEERLDAVLPSADPDSLSGSGSP